MPEDLIEKIEQDLNDYNSLEELRHKFIKEGYLEKDIDEAISKITRKRSGKSAKEASAERVFIGKEVLDRVGYGFVTHQFTNILFYLTGAGYFLIGLLNGLKTIISIFLSTFLKEYSKVHDVGKDFISKSGILFGFSFLFMAAAIKLKNVWLFSIALLIGSVGIVTYGDFYNRIIKETIKKEKMTHFLVRISYYGILITIAAFLLSAFLMDRFPMDGPFIRILGANYPVYGYLLSFEISAFSFILSGYLINYLDYKPAEKRQSLSKFIPEFFRIIKRQMGVFKNKLVLLMLILSVLISVVQLLGNSYYGIFIYRNFSNVGYGAFMNVAIVFAVALLVSFLAPFFTKKIEKVIGVAPMIVFGVLLIALMPFTLVYNPTLSAITLANEAAIFGAVIVGVALSLLANKVMHEEARKDYYNSISIASLIPIIIIVPIGAYFAQTIGLTQFFVWLSAGIAFLIMPIAFILVYQASKK
jgi:hypothetical protein